MKRIWWRVALTVLVIALTGRAPSVVNSLGQSTTPGIRLDLPASYVAISPISRLLDALTLLSMAQTMWLFGPLILYVAAVVISSPGIAGQSKARRLGVAVVSTVLFCAAAEVIAVAFPRPMAQLVVDDPAVVRVDFHSHTKASPDANQLFSAERNRAWHASGGFDVAYLTDHVKWGGAVAARAGNPVRAGDGTSLLAGVEGHHHRVSTILLGFNQADSTRLTGWGELKPGLGREGGQPVAILALPANLDSVLSATSDTLPVFSGVELLDAAPRGLAQLDRDENRIRSIAREAHLILVASSNNHGWGRTVAAWNLMRIPGWRELSPDSLGSMIEASFRNRDLAAVTIVERERPRLHGNEAALTLPVSLFQIAGGLTFSERAVWIAWIWGSFLLGLLFARRVPGTAEGTPAEAS